jgi:membrane protein
MTERITAGLAGALAARGRRAWSFWRAAGLRFWHDELFGRATALAFQTALALVPLFTIVLSLLSAFPGFDDAMLRVELWLLSVLTPHSLAAARDLLDELLARSGEASAVGALSLAAVVLLLLRTVGETFDRIFRIRRPRGLAQRLMAYWTFLTLGPLLFALALSLSGGLLDQGERALGGLLREPVALVRVLLPAAIEWVGFALVYWLMPGRQPPFRDALAGGGVATVLFEVIKAAFAFYLSAVASYESAYGALAAIPITLLWLEMAWAIALFGATVAALLEERRRAAAGDPATSPAPAPPG